MYRREVVTENNSFLFWLFKCDGLYYRYGIKKKKSVYPKELGYTKKQLDVLWDANLPIVDLYSIIINMKSLIDDVLEFKELDICDFRVVAKNKIVKLYNKQIYHIYESDKFKELEVKYKRVFTMSGGYITIGNITYNRNYGSRDKYAKIAIFNEFNSEDISEYIISKNIKKS